MTLNHSKTWPVSTLAVVQLRVDPQGKTYTNLDDEDRHSQEKTADPRGNGSRMKDNSEYPAKDTSEDDDIINDNERVLPLSKKHLELFTMSSVPISRTAVRTDTISTILDPAEFEMERIEEGVDRSKSNNPENGSLPSQKFHVLALTRIEETIDESGNEFHGVGRRPSIKVDNWDFIYTEKLTDPQIRCPVHHYTISSPNGAIKDTLLPPELPLDARKTTTLRRHYYPEGGWGWVVVVCAVLVHVLNHGVQLGCSQLVIPGAQKFNVETVHFAGQWHD
ncbi:hypothetical protein JTB14_027123 [Gonioctena quinquepunctata]|nr:hypothetical protein JTB14_027123 [Gonioctena quinquepunctata]